MHSIRSERFSILAAILLLLILICDVKFTLCAADTDILNVHLIAHSHDDVGWLNTVQGYYNADVRGIITTVFKEISEKAGNSDRKFIQVEMAYLSRWWADPVINDEMRATYRQLVRDGKIEMVLGGWVMHDEAVSHYVANIDQMSLGHRWIAKNIGDFAVPRYGWHIDPFGASAATAPMFADFCFDAHIYNRASQRTKNMLDRDLVYESIWYGSPRDPTNRTAAVPGNLGLPSLYKYQSKLNNETDDPTDPGLFVHMLDAHYGSPARFEFEMEPSNSPGITNDNLADRSEELAILIKGRAIKYRTKNILVPFGSDLAFQHARIMYENMDRLIGNINMNPSYFGMRIHYSTLHDYFAAVRQSQLQGDIRKPAAEEADDSSSSQPSNPFEWPTLVGDMLPYTENGGAWWTGFYTSRPSLKGHTRFADSILRVAEQILASVSILGDNYAPLQEFLLQTDPYNSIETLRTANAVAQHHDAVTGTAKAFVVNDYHKLLKDGIISSIALASKLVSILNLNGARLLIKPDYVNISQNVMDSMLPVYTMDPPSESLLKDLNTAFLNTSAPVKALSVSAYNSLPWPLIRTITVPFNDFGLSLQVSTTMFDTVERSLFRNEVQAPCQLMQRSSFSTIQEKVDEYLHLPPVSSHSQMLSFQALLPPFTSRTFMITARNPNDTSDSNNRICRKTVDDKAVSSTFNISNGYFTVIFDSSDGTIQSVYHHDLNRTFAFHHQLMSYNAMTNYGQAEGAYIMKSNANSARPISEEKPVYEVSRGSIFSEVRQEWPNGHSVVFRIFNLYAAPSSVQSWTTTGFIEVEYHLSAPEMDHNIIARFDTDIVDKKIRLWQDDSGIRFMQRDIDLSPDTSIDSQYFPLVSAAYIQSTDSSVQLTLLSSRSHGVSRRSTSGIEVMLHRRHSRDDWRGVNEALDDQEPISPKFRLMIDDIFKSEERQHVIQLDLAHPPAVFYSGAISTPVGTSRDKSSSSAVWCAVTMAALLNSSLDDVMDCTSNIIVASPPPIAMDIPFAVDIMTFSKPNASVPILARLHHLHDLTWMPNKFRASSPIREVNLSVPDVFPLWTIASGIEMSLGGVLPKASCVRTDWKNSASSPLSVNEYFQMTSNNLSNSSTQINVLPTGFRTLSLQFTIREDSSIEKLALPNLLLHSPDKRELSEFFSSFTFYALVALMLLIIITSVPLYQTYCPSRHYNYSAIQTDDVDCDLENWGPTQHSRVAQQLSKPVDDEI